MPDNIYVLDLQVTGAELVTINDDGLGEDAITVNGVYDRLVEISLCWTTLNGQTATSAARYFGLDGKYHRLVVNGLVENAVGSNGSDSILGNEFGNILHGDHKVKGPGAADTLRGGLGDDLMLGGVGDDLIAGDGDDDSLSGGDGNDTIEGGSGNDWCEGGAGADVLLGGGAAGDVLSYASSRRGVHISLTHGTTTTGSGGDAEGDQIAGFLTVEGSENADRITDTDAASLDAGANAHVFHGNGGKDKLVLGGGNDTGLGGTGNDLLFGGAGEDDLQGGDGQDKLAGGTGQDRLTGEAGADRFIFKSLLDSPNDLPDLITDFSALDGDRIDLRGIDANTTIRGNQAFQLMLDGFTGAAGELRLLLSGDDLTLEGDVDGDLVADFAIQLTGTQTLTEADLIL